MRDPSGEIAQDKPLPLSTFILATSLPRPATGSRP
jgi:hypothetical protein